MHKIPKNYIFWFALVFLGQSTLMFAQQILWEKTLHFGFETLYSVNYSNDNQILAGGNTSKFGIVVPQNAGFNRSILIKYNLQGDTIWVKKMPYLGHVKNLCPTGNGLIWAVCQVTEPNVDPLNNFYYPAVVLLQNDSAILLKQAFPQMHEFMVGDSYTTVDGGVIVFGNRSPSMTAGFDSDFYAFKRYCSKKCVKLKSLRFSNRQIFKA